MNKNRFGKGLAKVKGNKKDYQAKGRKKKKEEERRKVVSRTRQGFGELIQVIKTEDIFHDKYC